MTGVTIKSLLKSLREQNISKNLDIDITDIAQAYKISQDLADLQGGQISAYKLGATTELTRAIFNTTEVYYGPMLDREVFTRNKISNNCNILLPQFKGEAEIALRIGSDINNLDELTAANPFDAWCCALECPWSVFANLPEAGLTALIADRCASGALFLGEPKKISSLPIDATISIASGGVTIASGSILNSLVMPVEEASSTAIKKILMHGISLKKGQWISTGGITACVVLDHQAEVTVSMGHSTEIILPSGTVKR